MTPQWAGQPWPQGQPQQQYPAAYPPPPRRGRGRRWAAVAGALVLVLVVAGAAALALRWRGGDHPAADGKVRPVTSEPDRAWAWDSQDDIEQVYAGKDRIVVTLSHHRGIVVLGTDGHELWRDKSLKYDTAYVEEGDKVEGISYEGKTQSILFDRDGKELDRFEKGDYFYGEEDDGAYLIDDDHDLRKVDPETDQEEWSIAEGDAWTLDTDQVLTVSGNKVTSYSRKDGSTQWTTTLPAGYDDGLKENYDITLEANDRFVLVSTGTLTALDVRSGERLWTAPHGGTLSPMAEDRFTVVPSYHYGGDEEQPRGPFPIYAVDGKVGSIDLPAKDGYAYVYAGRVDGEELNIAPDAHAVFDADGKLVQRVDDAFFTSFDEGYYTLRGATIGYRTWHDDRAEWSITLTDVDPIEDKYDDEDHDVSMDPIDRGLVVNDRRSVWLYR